MAKISEDTMTVLKGIVERLCCCEDKKLGVWRAPYVNSFFDTRLVRRSNMLQADLALLGRQPSC